MIKTTLPNRRAIAQIVRDYRVLVGTSARQTSLRGFAEALSEALEALGRHISYQSVKNWEDGRHLPDAFLMVRLAEAGRYDWRGDFARDVLAALFPEHYEPASEIGRRAVAEHKDALVLRGRTQEQGGDSDDGRGNERNGQHQANGNGVRMRMQHDADRDGDKPGTAVGVRRSPGAGGRGAGGDGV